MRYSLAALLIAALVLVQSAAAADMVLASGVTVGPGETKPLAIALTSAPAEGISVTFTSSDTGKVTVTPATVYIPAGATAPDVQPQVTGVEFGSANISAAASGLTGDTQTVRVAGELLGPSSGTLTRNDTQRVTFVLSAPASQDVEIALRSDDPAVASVPETVRIPANATTVVVPVTGSGSGSTAIHATASAEISATVMNVTVVAANGITLPNVTVGVDESVPLQVTLGTPAPAGGITVTLVSNNTLTAKVNQPSVFIPAGLTAPATPPTVKGINIGITTITASAPGYSPGSSTVTVPATLSFSPQALTIAKPGNQERVLLALSESAPWGPETDPWSVGVKIQLTSSNPQVVAVPPVLSFYPDGSSFTTVQFMVTALAPGTTVITATGPSFITGTTMTITVLGGGSGGPASISATGGTPQSATVNTSFAAPLIATVRNASGNPVAGVTVVFTAPASGPSGSFNGGTSVVTNAAGVATAPAFTANSVAGSYVVTASTGGLTANFQLTNTAAGSAAISLPSGILVGTNQSVSFPVSLTTPAPPGGVTVTLASGNTTRVTVAPANIFIAGGATAPATQPQVTGVNFGAANITASAPGYASATRPVQVRGTLTFSPSSLTITGTGTQNLTLTLSSPAPAAGLTVSLASNNTSVATVPPSLSFSANTTSISVPVTAKSLGSAVITATATVVNVSDATASVTVNGASGILLASGVTVAPGESKPFPVRLAVAATTGVFVTLTSSDTSKATLNVTNVYIPPGATVPNIQPRVTGQNFGPVNITASAFGLTGDTETVRVIATLIGPSAVTINRGNTRNVTFVLPAPAPGALAIALTSDNPGVATVPASVTIQPNTTSVIVPVTGIGVGSTTIRMTSPDMPDRTIGITVVTPGGIT